MHWTLPLVAYATVDNLLELISTMKQCCCARMCPHVNEAFQLFTKYTCHLVGLVLVVGRCLSYDGHPSASLTGCFYMTPAEA